MEISLAEIYEVVSKQGSKNLSAKFPKTERKEWINIAENYK